jgi:hypothetical protein
MLGRRAGHDLAQLTTAPTVAYHTSGIAANNCEWGDIAGHHCACSDYCASSDPAALKHEHSLTNPG